MPITPPVGGTNPPVYANTPPVVTIADRALPRSYYTQVSPWINYSDLDGHPATMYEFWDGGVAVNSASFHTPNPFIPGGQYAAETSILVAAADIDTFHIWAGRSREGGSETMFVRAFDGQDWSAWDSFVVTSGPNYTPSANVDGTPTLDANEWTRMSDWVTYADPNHDAAYEYEFWDGGVGANSAYFAGPYSSHYAAESSIIVHASQLDEVWLRGGTIGGSETMFVRAHDTYGWGEWDSFTVVTHPNSLPSARISDHSLTQNEWVQANTWLSYSDFNGQAATRYEFWDGGVGGGSGYFYSNRSEHHAAETSVVVQASELSSVWIRGGAAGGSETMFVRAFDGLEWGEWDQFTLTTTPNAAPTAAIGDHSVARNEWVQANTWLNYSDVEGNAAVQYEFWDGGVAGSSGYLYSNNNAHHAAETSVLVMASQLSSVWVRGGSASGSETMFVRAFDGNSWSEWDSFTLTTT